MLPVRDETLRQWCDLETACWRTVRTPAEQKAALHDHWNTVSMSLFLFDIDGREVRLRAKPAFFDDAGMAGDHVFASRARLYHDFFQACVAERPLDGRITLAVDVGDAPLESQRSPILSFQKRRFSPNVLIPDVDFLYFNYEAERDLVAFEDKQAGVVFAGSSTGGTVTAAAVEQGLTPRLALARALADHPEIDFRIGLAVQYDEEDTRRLLEAQPWFGSPLPWDEQLTKRFILSVDGNGATCSRVVRTLRSRSVLMKMNSPHLLFYFHGLRPFEHYLPVANVTEMEEWLALDDAALVDRPGLVDRANSFAEACLNRSAVETYTALVLQTLIDIEAGQS